MEEEKRKGRGPFDSPEKSMYRYAMQEMIMKNRQKGAVKYNMWSRVKNKVGQGARRACVSTASKYQGRGVRGGTMRIVNELCHQSLKVCRRSRGILKRHGMWPHNNRAPSQ